MKAPKTTATRVGSGTRAAKPAKVAKERPVRANTAKNADKPATPRDGSKKAVILVLLGRKGGATLAEIMSAP